MDVSTCEWKCCARVCVCVCVCVCACARLRAFVCDIFYMCEFVCACVCARCDFTSAFNPVLLSARTACSARRASCDTTAAPQTKYHKQRAPRKLQQARAIRASCTHAQRLQVDVPLHIHAARCISHWCSSLVITENADEIALQRAL